MSEPLLVENSCWQWPCPALLSQVGCELSVESQSAYCSLGLSGTLAWDNSLSASGPTFDRACTGLVAEDGTVEIGCPPPRGSEQACSLRVAAQADTPPPFEVVTRSLASGLGLRGIDEAWALWGWVLEGDRLTIARRLDPEAGGCEGGVSAQSEFVHVRLPDLEPTVGATLPIELRSFTPGLEAQEYLVVLGGERPKVARMSHNGELLATNDLGPELDWTPIVEPEGVRCMGVDALLLDASTELAVVLARQPLPSGELEMRLFVVDARTLEVAQVDEPLPRGTGAVHSPEPGVVEFMRKSTDRMQLRLNRSGEPPALVQVGRSVRQQAGLSVIAALLWPEEDRLILLNPGGPGPVLSALLVLDLRSGEQHIRPMWEGVGAPLAISRWPGRSELALVATSRWHPSLDYVLEDTRLAFFDVRARRFMGGAVTVGGSAILHMEAHRDGSVYALAPIDGRVLRITPIAER